MNYVIIKETFSGRIF